MYPLLALSVEASGQDKKGSRSKSGALNFGRVKIKIPPF